MTTPDTGETQIHTLADGRKLAYVEFGAPNGKPAFHFHGGPSSRLEGKLLSAAAAEESVRLIAMDRPGIGLSDYQPKRKLLDWPDDVAALADALGIDRFAVTGWSEGGPWSIACARALPHRLTIAVNLAGGCYGAIDPDAILALMNPLDRFGGKMALHFRPGLSVMFQMIELMVRHAPEKFAATLRKSSCPSDQAVLDQPHVSEALIEAMAECFRTGSRGLVTDAQLIYKRWGFELSEVEMPVHTWQGSADTLVPAEINRQVSEALPKGILREFDGEGHFMPITHANELFALVASQRS